MSSTTKYTLKPSLEANFEGIIWKVETDPINGIIAVETRNPEDRTAGFSAFNFKTGVTLFRDVSVQDSWHWGLDKVCHNFVYLHSYVNEKTPEHKSIIALNTAGSIAWQIFNRTLDTATAEGLVVYNPSVQQKQYELLNPASGVTESFRISNFVPLERNIYFPEIISPMDLLPAIEELKTLVGPVSYLAHNGKKCISFHAAPDSVLSQYLLIISDGNIMHKEILEHNIQKINPEPFYIEQGHLFCVRNNKAEIVSYLV
ncbi:uncharacterized protein DUF4905 [Arcticibacter pallidicorallinus]|uniref:Uncharacterized protein DUF4905 n=1 Tax=Arcticibacter pallidicorallinus TaxID=1259464 RepID=A0A2T0U3G8_9SPHI|nr:DUF4905 domain-containing protein [Arcticibacter pallidicorallinus]PRY52408.1 uncharacterized protein DUF4905 [Arcticibacter pallidicorallinus]